MTHHVDNQQQWSTVVHASSGGSLAGNLPSPGGSGSGASSLQIACFPALFSTEGLCASSGSGTVPNTVPQQRPIVDQQHHQRTNPHQHHQHPPLPMFLRDACSPGDGLIDICVNDRDENDTNKNNLNSTATKSSRATCHLSAQHGTVVSSNPTHHHALTIVEAPPLIEDATTTDEESGDVFYVRFHDDGRRPKHNEKKNVSRRERCGSFDSSPTTTTADGSNLLLPSVDSSVKLNRFESRASSAASEACSLSSATKARRDGVTQMVAALRKQCATTKAYADDDDDDFLSSSSSGLMHHSFHDTLLRCAPDDALVDFGGSSFNSTRSSLFDDNNDGCPRPYHCPPVALWNGGNHENDHRCAFTAGDTDDAFVDCQEKEERLPFRLPAADCNEESSVFLMTSSSSASGHHAQEN